MVLLRKLCNPKLSRTKVQKEIRAEEKFHPHRFECIRIQCQEGEKT